MIQEAGTITTDLATIENAVRLRLPVSTRILLTADRRLLSAYPIGHLNTVSAVASTVQSADAPPVAYIGTKPGERRGGARGNESSKTNRSFIVVELPPFYLTRLVGYPGPCDWNGRNG